MTTTNMKFFALGGCYTGGMCKFLASGGTHVRHSKHVRSCQHLFKNYLYEKSCHKEVIENTFHVSKCLKVYFDASNFTVNSRFKDYEIVFPNCKQVQPRNENINHIIKKL